MFGINRNSTNGESSESSDVEEAAQAQISEEDIEAALADNEPDAYPATVLYVAAGSAAHEFGSNAGDAAWDGATDAADAVGDAVLSSTVSGDTPEDAVDERSSIEDLLEVHEQHLQ